MTFLSLYGDYYDNPSKVGLSIDNGKVSNPTSLKYGRENV